MDRSGTPVSYVEAVRWAYRFVLGREAENDGVLKHWASLQDGRLILTYFVPALLEITMDDLLKKVADAAQNLGGDEKKEGGAANPLDAVADVIEKGKAMAGQVGMADKIDELVDKAETAIKTDLDQDGKVGQ